MKKKIIACLLAAAVCISTVVALGKDTKVAESKSPEKIATTYELNGPGTPYPPPGA